MVVVARRRRGGAGAERGLRTVLIPRKEWRTRNFNIGSRAVQVWAGVHGRFCRCGRFRRNSRTVNIHPQLPAFGQAGMYGAGASASARQV